MASRKEKSGKQWQILFSWAPNSLWMVTAAVKLKRRLFLGRKALTNLDSILKSRDIISLTKVHIVEAMIFPVVMYRCKSWAIKKAELWRIDAFELWCWRRLLKSPFDYREIKPVHLKGNQSWVFIGRTHAEAEAPILWPPYEKNWLIGKDPDDGKVWRQEKGMTEEEMVGWHHWLNRCEFEQVLGIGDGQGRLVCYSPRGPQRVRHDWTTELNWTKF